MSKTLTFEVPDEVHQALVEAAARSGRSVEALAIEWLARNAPRPPRPLTEQQRQEAAARLRRHAGVINGGDPNAADNERIDADLAGEYGNAHQGPG
jgi:plasmid stability protein